jgi:hypothetical protein
MDLTGWAPARVRGTPTGAIVNWRWVGDLRFDDPFFEESLTRAIRRPFALLFGIDTPLEALREAGGSEALTPSGLIFHMSRCGSTLVSQMAAAHPGVLTISEAAAIEGILRTRRAGVPDQTVVEWLRWTVAALGRPRHGERSYVLKLDSWSTLDLDLFERAFPDTPWVFLYRDPTEVLASHLRHAGPQVIPGVLPPEVLGLAPASLAEMTLEEYAALALARIASAGLANAGSTRGLLVDYRELPDAVFTRILPHFGIDLAPDERAALEAAASRDAKNPAIAFEPDAEAKQRELTDVGRAVVERVLQPVHDELTRKRRADAPC